VQFGSSQVPATPTDPDWAKVDGIRVSFNPWQVLWQRQLHLQVNLIRPKVYLEQNPVGLWVTTRIQTRPETGPIQIRLTELRLQDGMAVLSPRPKPGKARQQVQFRNLQGGVNLLENNRRFSYVLRGNPSSKGAFRIRGESKSIPQQGVLSRLNLESDGILATEVDRLIHLPVDIQAGRIDGKVDVTLNPDLSYGLRGQAKLQNLALRAPGTPQLIQNATGWIELNDTSVDLKRVQAKFDTIPLIATGRISPTEGFNLSAQIKQVTIPQFCKTFEIKPPVPVTGKMGADIRMTGSLQAPIISGTTRNLGPIKVDRIDLAAVGATFRLDSASQRLHLSQMTAKPTLGGEVNGQGWMDVGQSPSINVVAVARQLVGDRLARLYSDDNTPPPLRLGEMSATAHITGPVSDVQTAVNWAAPQATYPARGELVVRDQGDRLELRQLQAQVLGGTVTAQGVAVQRQWQGTASLAGLALAQVSPDLRGQLQGQLRLAGNLDDLRLAAMQADGRVQFSQGISVIQTPIAAQVTWDGQRLNVPLATAPGLKAHGTLMVSQEAIPEITGLDLQVQTTDLALDSLLLPLPEIARLQGTTDFVGRITGSPANPQMRGQLGVQNLAVGQFGFEAMQGSLALSGPQGLMLALAGPRDRIDLQLDAQFQPLQVGVQRGAMQLSGQRQGDLFQLALAQVPIDALQASLPAAAGHWPPLQGILSGQLAVHLRHWEIAAAALQVDRPRFGTFPTTLQSDQIQARFQYVDGVGRGTISAQKPQLGLVPAQTLAGNFVYANQRLQIPELVLQKDQSRFTLSGTLDWRSSPDFQGRVQVERGQVADILAAAQIFTLEDVNRVGTVPTYGRASDLGTLSVGTSNTPDANLLDQLKRFAEINAKLTQIADERRNLKRVLPGQREATLLLPEWADIRGEFDSQVTFRLNPKGLEIAQLDLTGTNWQWRPYPGYTAVQAVDGKPQVVPTDTRILQAENVFLNGNYQDGVLNLRRAQLQVGQAQLDAQLTYGEQATTGQFNVRNLPMQEIQKFYPLPLLIEGDLNATTTISGTRTTPQAQGTISLKNGWVNGTPIKSAGGFFGYDDGQLNLDTSLQINSPQPLRISGTLPLPLPFMGLYPKDNQISLAIDVENEGLALLNVLNPQMSWQGGEGRVKLQINGQWPTPIVNGAIDLAQGIIQVQGLPEPLTDIQGQIRFDTDWIRVEDLRGQFSRGQVTARGSLPLLGVWAQGGDRRSVAYAISTHPTEPSIQHCRLTDTALPLQVDLEGIQLAYKGLYQGAVNGCVQVGGTLLAPRIGGEIQLSNGKVLLSEQMATAGSAGQTADASTSLELDRLSLTLGKQLQIVQAPILNFVAQGTLVVDGPLEQLRPVGEIVLHSGQVNLFTTQFVLAQGAPQTATFLSEQGLDPNLAIRLIASVPEVTRNPVPTTTTTSEVADKPVFVTNLGALQTVRVEARVSGKASQLFENLQLTSSPSRSQNEILGLLGGGFVNTLGRDSGPLAIANLAGSALFTNVQGLIGNALGFSEFRLFPTLSTDESKRSSTLGMAAEAGVNLTPNLSLSVLQLLTATQSTQFGLRYHINQNTLMRGSTDFGGDSRLILEYETRY
jgi:translocation and assembly module TamB